jgi:SAM-dependent methyltransferase
MGIDGRTSIICSLLPEHPERLLDVGCGPIDCNYPYAGKARHVTCIDWSPRSNNSVPSNVECVNADFTQIDLAQDAYDFVIAADVFEHILLEQERLFVSKCVSVLKPGGSMIISVPHRGTFACLDPYQVKPTIHRILRWLGMYEGVHNGCCDIRKGHKHYSLEELAAAFLPLRVSRVVYFGYFFDPLVNWAFALSTGRGRLPGSSWLERGRHRELNRDYGRRSFNIVVSFVKP